MADAVVERWAYVRAGGLLWGVDLLHLAPCWSEWRIGEPAVWEVDAETCVRAAAAARGHEVARVLSPADLDVELRLSRAAPAHGVGEVVSAAERCVELRLSRASAAAWSRLLAEWSAVGTLGEPGEELRGELARVLGEGEG